MKQRRLKKACSFLLVGVMILTIFSYTGNEVYAQEGTEVTQSAENEEMTELTESETALPQSLLKNDSNNEKTLNSIADINGVIEVPTEGMVITGGVYYGISKQWYETNNPDGKSKYTIVNIDFSNATNLTTINNQAAMGCSLTGVLDLSHTKIETLGKSAFNGCTGVTGVILPETLKNIGNEDSGSVFNGCTSLQFVRTANGNSNAIFELPKTLNVIGRQSFKGCTGFPANTTITIPASVRIVGSEAFYKSPSITTIQIIKNIR